MGFKFASKRQKFVDFLHKINDIFIPRAEMFQVYIFGKVVFTKSFFVAFLSAAVSHKMGRACED